MSTVQAVGDTCAMLCLRFLEDIQHFQSHMRNDRVCSLSSRYPNATGVIPTVLSQDLPKCKLPFGSVKLGMELPRCLTYRAM